MDRRAARHARTRREIVEAAWELSGRDGLTGWTLRDVASALGMQAPSLYGYFSSKHDLYDAMFSEGCRDLLAVLPEIDSSREAQDQLRAGMRAFVDYCSERPALFQLLFQHSVPGFTPSPESYAVAVDLLDRMRTALAAAGVTSARAVDLWTAVITGLISQQISNDLGGSRWTDLTDEAVALLLTASV